MPRALDVYRSDPNLMNAKAELLKVLAHPVRLCIVRGLMEQESCNVSHMQSCLNIPQSTISQHLGKLRAANVITADRRGTEVYYHIASSEAAAVIRALFPSDQ